MAKTKKTKGPGKYQQWITEEGLIKIEGWARDGLTDEQIAHNIGIQRTTLYDWKNKYPDISDTLKKGKEVIDRQVENALLKRALGYDFDEQTFETVTIYRTEKRIENGEEVEIKIPETKEIMTKRVTKQVSPDTTAQIFWLKNRKPKDWRDKTEVAVMQTKSEAVEEMERYMQERRDKP